MRVYQNKYTPSSFVSEVKVQKIGHGSRLSHNSHQVQLYCTPIKVYRQNINAQQYTVNMTPSLVHSIVQVIDAVLLGETPSNALPWHEIGWWFSEQKWFSDELKQILKKVATFSNENASACHMWPGDRFPARACTAGVKATPFHPVCLSVRIWL